tara:strand:+ start:429 stop:788 length:360 start_codon:yes stop_codon:yes gene_type:complete
MLDTDIKKEFKMINAALERLDLKSGTMAFIISVVVALFAFYEKDSSTEHSDINDKRLEDKIESFEYKVTLLEQSNQNVIINKTRIEDNSEDIKELKKEIREGFNKIDDKLDKLVNSSTL